MVAEGQFREDLYLPSERDSIHLPPLPGNRNEYFLFCTAFSEEIFGFKSVCVFPAAPLSQRPAECCRYPGRQLRCMMAYSWPGHVPAETRSSAPSRKRAAAELEPVGLTPEIQQALLRS